LAQQIIEAEVDLELKTFWGQVSGQVSSFWRLTLQATKENTQGI
jgi:hypothetical protein